MLLVLFSIFFFSPQNSRSRMGLVLWSNGPNSSISRAHKETGPFKIKFWAHRNKYKTSLSGLSSPTVAITILQFFSREWISCVAITDYSEILSHTHTQTHCRQPHCTHTHTHTQESLTGTWRCCLFDGTSVPQRERVKMPGPGLRRISPPSFPGLSLFPPIPFLSMHVRFYQFRISLFLLVSFSDLKDLDLLYNNCADIILRLFICLTNVWVLPITLFH